MQLATLMKIADKGESIDPLPDGASARSLRSRRDVSPTTLAAAIGISERTLLGFERGETKTLGSAAARLRLGRILRRLAVSEAPK